MWFFVKLVRQYISGKIEVFLSFVAELVINHPYILRKLSPRVKTKIAQTKTIVGKTNRIRSLIFFTIRVFVTFVLIANATFILWSGEGEIAKIIDTSSARLVNVETGKTLGYAINDKSRLYISRFYGLSTVFLTLLTIMPSAVGINIIDTVFAAGSFTSALLLGPIWTTMVIAVAWLEFRPFDGAMLLSATVLFAYVALTFLYNKGKKRIEEEKKISRLLDNVVDQVKDGVSFDEIEFKEDVEGASKSWESFDARTLKEYTIKRLKAAFVSLCKVLSIFTLILVLLNFLNILPISALTTYFTRNEASEKLSQAMIHSNMAQIAQLIDEGADVNTKGNYPVPGITPLIFNASLIPNLGVIQLLIEKGANVNATDDLGNTAIMWNVMSGVTDYEILRTLIKNGAKIDAANMHGTTPLMQVADRGFKPEILKILLDSGADVTLKDRDGKTALDYAEHNKYLIGTEAYNLLREKTLSKTK